ncbi:MAG: hypothetical protein ACHQII_06210 [Bacteroidia bacterium]
MDFTSIKDELPLCYIASIPFKGMRSDSVLVIDAIGYLFVTRLIKLDVGEWFWETNYGRPIIGWIKVPTNFNELKKRYNESI